MLCLEKIEKVFGEKSVLSDVSITVNKGERAIVYGMSGSGKTTLLRIAAGLEKPTGGNVRRKGKTAVVFAEARLFPSVTVLENVTAVMGGDKTVAKEKALGILSEVGLSEAALLYPRELSTGMAARVSLARAVAYDADIYLLDEPFKSLDGEIKAMVMTYLNRFFHDKAVLIISHDKAEAEAMKCVRYTLSEGILRKESALC